jgi:hypothetical protein
MTATTQDLRHWIKQERQRSVDRLDELMLHAAQQQRYTTEAALLSFKRIAFEAEVKLSNRMTACAGKAHPQRGVMTFSVSLFCAACNAHVAEHEFRMAYRHELAHLFCACRDTLTQWPGHYDNGHGANWKRVCRMLDGDAAVTHKLKRATHSVSSDARPTPPRVFAPRRNDGLNPLRNLLSF